MQPTLYAQFDGDEVDGIKYALGDEIRTDKHDAGTLAYLTETGRIAAGKPATTIVIPADEGKPVEEMSRLELEQGAMAALSSRLSDASDDQLREAIEAGRERDQAARDAQAASRADTGTGDDNRGSTADYDEIKDKPLAGLKTADLVLIAEHENVSLDGANTNPDRVKAIETARAKPAS